MPDPTHEKIAAELDALPNNYITAAATHNGGVTVWWNGSVRWQIPDVMIEEAGRDLERIGRAMQLAALTDDDFADDRAKRFANT